MMIKYILIFVCIWILSFISSCVIAFFVRTPMMKKIFDTFFILGIMIHELSHYLMCLLIHVPMERARILPNKDDKGNLKSSIKPAQPSNFL